MGSLIAALWRRKLLTALAALLAAVAGYVVAMTGGPTYSYSATTVLLPPGPARNVAPDTTDYTLGNPLFFLGNLNQARDILIGAMTSKDVEAAIARKYPGTTYSVDGDVLSSAPVVVLTAIGSDEQISKDLVGDLVARLPVVLADVQQGVGVEADAQITSYQLTAEAEPVVSHKAQLRSAIVAVGASAVVLIFLIGAIDGLLRARQARRRDPESPEEMPEELPEPLVSAVWFTRAGSR
ncbi:hypothetical protein [Nocardioides sp.]|uniref:hypothetical protein n=1 Tax=Nocardioides sp. TaxID=35761 RepID=UPI0039E5FCD3